MNANRCEIYNKGLRIVRAINTSGIAAHQESRYLREVSGVKRRSKDGSNGTPVFSINYYVTLCRGHRKYRFSHLLFSSEYDKQPRNLLRSERVGNNGEVEINYSKTLINLGVSR